MLFCLRNNQRGSCLKLFQTSKAPKSFFQFPIKIHGKTNKISVSTTLKIRTKRQSIAKSWEDFLQTVNGERTVLKCIISGLHLIGSSEIIGNFCYSFILCCVFSRINKGLSAQEYEQPSFQYYWSYPLRQPDYNTPKHQ